MGIYRKDLAFDGGYSRKTNLILLNPRGEPGKMT